MCRSGDGKRNNLLGWPNAYLPQIKAQHIFLNEHHAGNAAYITEQGGTEREDSGYTAIVRSRGSFVRLRFENVLGDFMIFGSQFIAVLCCAIS